MEKFKETLAIDAADGLTFNTAKLSVATIRKDQIHGGMRLKTTANLGKAVIPIQIDIGFGDAVTVPEYTIQYPSLLDYPVAPIRAYSPATVMAEKFHAVVEIGMINSRMKDFYDLWLLPQTQDVAVEDLLAAVRKTFMRRETPIPAVRPESLSAASAQCVAKQSQWNAYAESIMLEGISWADVVEAVWKTFKPICLMANN